MTGASPRQLDTALRACASGIHPLEAGTSLLIECGSWLHQVFRKLDISSRVELTRIALEHAEAGVPGGHDGAATE
jgi:hypothetical protein